MLSCRKYLFIVLFFGPLLVLGQGRDTTINYSKRKNIVGYGNAIAYTGAMTGLYSLWYKDYPLGSFHFFNDNKQWLQMDKVGHAYSCYAEGWVGVKMMKWAGYSRKQSIFIGGSYGFLLQTSVEIFDGFSENWGASSGDIAANALGTGMVIGQEWFWDEQRIQFKFSYFPTKYPDLRPNILGEGPTRILKDYNGQTYWLSVNLKSFMSEESKMPPWLNIAVGYGADGLLGGDDNIFESNGMIFDYSSVDRKRQFYISPDIDFTKIKTKNKFLRGLFVVMNGFKMPMPALQF
jgi:hypothetical protein